LKTKDETYKLIEDILIPRDVYHNSIYFSQQIKDFFTALNNSEQKEIFDSILDLMIYNTYYKNSDNEIKKLNILYNDNKIKLDKIEVNLTILNENQKLIDANHEKNKIVLGMDIKKIRDENEELRKSVLSLNGMLSVIDNIKYEEYIKNISENENKLKQLSEDNTKRI
jgi:hypothetical protein